MARPILMPQVGQDLTEGKLTALNVKVGDKVKKGDIVAEVESEKAVFEVEAFETGTILEIRHAVGDMATVLEPLMMVGEEGETVAAAPAATVEPAGESEEIIAAKGMGEDLVRGQAPLSVAAPAAGLVGEDTVLRTGTGGGSSPLARRLAATAGIDIGRVTGSGPRGAVLKRDVEAFGRDNTRRAGSSVVSFAGAAAASRNEAGGASALRTLQSGTGDPVLLIHGFGGELSAWRPFLMHLKLANPILAVDLPAHGGNAATTAEDFSAVAAAVRGAIGGEGVERLHLVGHSVGAAVAASIAGGGDLDVRSLTLISPAGLGPKINGDYVNGFLGATTEGALKAWLELLVGDPASLPGVLVRSTLAAREAGPLVENQRRLAGRLFADNTQLFAVREALARFEGPTRAIVGLDDRIVPAEHSAALPPHVALHRLPGIGHLPQLEAAALVGRLVAETVRSAG